MRNASILFLLIFGVCAGHLFGQNSETVEQEKRFVPAKEIYVKYEVDKNAIFTFLPNPELTPEATKNFAPDEMIVDLLLKADGTVDNVVLRGSLKHGMYGRVLAAIRKIKFEPAELDGVKVSQRAHVKYGIKVCKNDLVCTYAFELTP